MQRYFEEVSSVSDILELSEFSALPRYIADAFVWTDELKEELRKALEALTLGGNVLVTGSAGTGKTAFMLMVLLRLLGRGLGVARLLDGFPVGREHERRGTILFCDDLPRYSDVTVSSIRNNSVRGVIATAREEEIPLLERKLGCGVREVFGTVIRLRRMPRGALREILTEYARREGIAVRDAEAIDLVAEKAMGLPVYIWQFILELKIMGLDLTKEVADRVPRGMYNYVDDILWRVIDRRRDRVPVLLTLITVADIRCGYVDADLYTFIYLVAKEEVEGVKADLKDALKSDLLEDVTRYLIKDARRHRYALPHDSWRDVLRGRGGRLIAPEVNKILSVFDEKRRRELLERAARRAWSEVVSKSGDRARIRLFLESVREALGSDIVLRRETTSEELEVSYVRVSKAFLGELEEHIERKVERRVEYLLERARRIKENPSAYPFETYTSAVRRAKKLEEFMHHDHKKAALRYIFGEDVRGPYDYRSIVKEAVRENDYEILRGRGRAELRGDEISIVGEHGLFTIRCREISGVVKRNFKDKKMHTDELAYILLQIPLAFLSLGMIWELGAEEPLSIARTAIASLLAWLLSYAPSIVYPLFAERTRLIKPPSYSKKVWMAVRWGVLVSLPLFLVGYLAAYLSTSPYAGAGEVAFWLVFFLLVIIIPLYEFVGVYRVASKISFVEIEDSKGYVMLASFADVYSLVRACLEAASHRSGDYDMSRSAG